MDNKLDVIIVDDSGSSRMALRWALHKAGYTCIEAQDGLDGLAKIRANRTARLIISDIRMPRMDGLEMLEILKQDSGICPPVLILTRERPEIIARAKRQGIKGWILKPFTPELLIAAVKKLIDPP